MPGTLNHSPADVVRKVLISIGQGTDPDNRAAWPVYESGEPDLPDDCITLYDTQGRDWGRTSYDGERAEFHGIQVRVRSATKKQGYAKTRAIVIAMDTEVYDLLVGMDTDTYRVHSINRTGDCLHIGKDGPNSKRSLFTINLLASIRIVQEFLLQENYELLFQENGKWILIETSSVMGGYFVSKYFGTRYFPNLYF